MRIIFALLTFSLKAAASPAECKLAFYNFNRAHEKSVEAVGVDFGGGGIALGFRHDSKPTLQQEADMSALIRMCMSTQVMEPILYHFKSGQKSPTIICTNFNPLTLAMVCNKYSCHELDGKSCKSPRLVKGDKDGKPVEL